MIEELGTRSSGCRPVAAGAHRQRQRAHRRRPSTRCPQQLKLIDDSVTVLDTQSDVAAQLKSWAATLRVVLRPAPPERPGPAQHLRQRHRRQQAAAAAAGRQRVRAADAARQPHHLQLDPGRCGCPTCKAILAAAPATDRRRLLRHARRRHGALRHGQPDAADQPAEPRAPPATSPPRSAATTGRQHSDWGGPANLDAYCHSDGTATTSAARATSRAPGQRQRHQLRPLPGPASTASQATRRSASRTAARRSPARSTSRGRESAAAPTGVPNLPYDPSTGAAHRRSTARATSSATTARWRRSSGPTRGSGC